MPSSHANLMQSGGSNKTSLHDTQAASSREVVQIMINRRDGRTLV
jgi:hypothetical protein